MWQGGAHDTAWLREADGSEAGDTRKVFRVSGKRRKAPVCRHFLCRRRDSNPRHADYDSAALWLYSARIKGWGTQKGTQPRGPLLRIALMTLGALEPEADT